MAAALLSMTGYARAAGGVPGVSFVVELKSVNGRGLDLRLRLAPGFDALESEIRRLIGKAITRGSLTVSLAVDREGEGGRVVVNHQALDAVLDKATISGIAKNFLRVVAANRRLFAVDQIIRGFHAHVARHKGEVTAEVTVAEPLNDARLSEIKDALKAVTGKDVQVAVEVDPSIIGGLKVKVGSRIRCHVRIASVTDIPTGKQLTVRHTIEIEGEDKPACVAETVVLLLPQ